MNINHSYLLKVWLLASFLIALGCACFPVIRTSPIIYVHKTWFYNLGMFFGVIVYQIKYSLGIFICLYLILYLLLLRFRMSEISLRIILILFFLAGVFISNQIYFPWTWFHSYSYSYSIAGMEAFIVIDTR